MTVYCDWQVHYDYDSVLHIAVLIVCLCFNFLMFHVLYIGHFVLSCISVSIHLIAAIRNKPFIHSVLACQLNNNHLFRKITAAVSHQQGNNDSNVPPPLLKHRYGNRQTFPRPTANPTADRMKSSLPPHMSRCLLLGDSVDSLGLMTTSMPCTDISAGPFAVDNSVEAIDENENYC